MLRNTFKALFLHNQLAQLSDQGVQILLNASNWVASSLPFKEKKDVCYVDPILNLIPQLKLVIVKMATSKIKTKVV